MDGNNNWDLFAVVRGCLPSVMASSADDFPFFVSSSVLKEERLEGGIFSFSDITPMPNYSYELDESWKKCYVKGEEEESRGQQHQSDNLMNSNGGSASMFIANPQQFDKELKQLHKPISNTSRSKRSRKSQQKKVVCQVPADGVSSDLWAWRKYGQKPIKGSPYPRGYYRCSSSKGCHARKQVERSRANPSMLIITYTAEHNHPMPTHRNSLAGSTRQKLPPNPPGPTNDDQPSMSPKCPDDKTLDQEEEEDDEFFSLGDVDLTGENDMVFLGMEVIGVPANSPATMDGDYCLEDESSFEEHFLRPTWLDGGSCYS